MPKKVKMFTLINPDKRTIVMNEGDLVQFMANKIFRISFFRKVGESKPCAIRSASQKWTVVEPKPAK